MYEKKLNLEKLIKKYKTYYVVESFEQCFICNYTKIWASIIMINFQTKVMVMVAGSDFWLERIYMVLTYFYGCLIKKKAIHIELLTEDIKNRKDYIILLSFVLYGLKQKARVRYMILYSAILKFFFNQTY